MPEKKRAHPNILLIFTDQQRWDTIGAYGNSVIQTPNLDRLAAEGAVFDNAITPCPVCVPARAATVTGYAAGKTGCMNNGLPISTGDRDTICGHLSSSGYHNQAIGKMHFIPHRPGGQTYGMDHMMLSEEMRFVRMPESGQEPEFDDYDRFLIKHNAWGWEKPPEIGYNEIKPLVNGLPKELHVTQWCGDRTVEWLKKGRPQDRPFFLWSSFVKPHVPYDCPSHLIDLYDPEEVPAPWVSEKDRENINPHYRSNRRALEWDLYSDQANKRARACYYANISFIDEQVGRILAALREQGLEQNTLVIFTSDHGDMMGDHGQWFKSQGYEGSLHIPLLARWPGVITAGTRCGEAVSLLDLFPTFLNAAGVAWENERPGDDLTAFLGASPRVSRDLAISEIDPPPHYKLHVRHKQWKYLYYQNGGYEELYDLRNDPHELVDLSKDIGYGRRKEQLKSAAIDWIRKYSNPVYALDSSGGLRSEPFDSSTGSVRWGSRPSPYSRMPWDIRVPPGTIPEELQSWWWKTCGGDYSQLVAYAKAKQRTRSGK